MKNLLISTLFVILSGCATSPSLEEGVAGIADGVWTGEIRSEAQLADSSKAEDAFTLLLAACRGEVRFWSTDGDGMYTRMGEEHTLRSYPDSHLAYILRKDTEQPGWVEIHSYALLDIDMDTTAVQWSRAVNNRGKEASDKERYFFKQGSGLLRRIKSECDRQFMAPKAVVSKSADGAPKPLAVFTAEDVLATNLALWRPTDPSVFRSSSFSEAELKFLRHRIAFDRHYGQVTGDGKSLNDCRTLKVLAIEPLVQHKDGSKREVWKLDACSIKSSMTMVLSEDELKDLK